MKRVNYTSNKKIHGVSTKLTEDMVKTIDSLEVDEAVEVGFDEWGVGRDFYDAVRYFFSVYKPQKTFSIHIVKVDKVWIVVRKK